MEIRVTKETKRGRYRQKYELSDLENAFNKVVKENVSVKRAAKLTNVPETTLRDRVAGRISLHTLKSGTGTLFTQEEEEFLAAHVLSMGEIGCGYTRNETLNLASDYAVQLGYRDRQHPLSHFWLYSFIERHPQIKVRKPINLESVRAKSAKGEAISSYFKELKMIMDKHGFQDSSESIYNINEKQLSMDVVPVKGAAGVHSKPQKATTGKSKIVTMIGAVSANGTSIPPFFVFPGKRMRADLLEGATPGVQGTVTESGCSNTEAFSNYLKNHFLKYVQDPTTESPLLVLYDGHKSHVSLPLIKWAQDHHIILFVIPPQSSPLLQPLDVGSRGPYELRWTAACRAHLQETSSRVITRYEVCSIACKVHSSTITPSNIMSSFKGMGIYPLKADVVPEADTSTAPSTEFQQIVTESTDVPSADTFLDIPGGDLSENPTAAKVRKT